jgi:hypothetical protein
MGPDGQNSGDNHAAECRGDRLDFIHFQAAMVSLSASSCAVN